MPFKPIAQLDFSGGANLVVNPYLISQKQSADVENMILDEHGSLRTRDGVKLLTTSPDLANPIYYRGILSKVNGQEFPFAIQGGDTGGTIAADTTAGTTFSGTTGSVNITLGGTATALVASVHLDVPKSITSVTYDGVAMTKLVEASVSDGYVSLWGLLNPTTGSSKALQVTLGSSGSGVLRGRSYTNTTGFGNTGSTSTVTSGAISLVMVSATNHMVVDALSCNSSSAANPNQTSDYNTTYSDNDRARGQHAAGAASVTMEYTSVSGTTTIGLVAVDLLTGGNVLWNTTAQPWTNVGSLNNEILPDSVSMSDKVVIIHGYATPKHWDGTTLGTITAGVGQTVPPGAKHGIFHLGALWVWNTSATTTSLDGPSSLRASATNDMNDWPNANQIFVAKDDGQEGMGIVPFTIVETGISPTSTLIAFKNYSGYQITGVFGASTFSVQPIKSDMGCVAPRTIQFVSGFGVIRLTHKGFALYNGVEDRLISEEMRPAIFGGHDFAQLDFSAVNRSWAVQSQNPPLYVAACPVTGTALTRIFVYDLIRRGWTICTLPIDLSTMNLFFTRSQFPVIHAGENSGGGIYEMFSGEDADQGGVPIAWSLKTRSFFAGNQMTPTYWRRAQISLNIEPNTVVDVTPIVNGQARSIQHHEIPDSFPPEAHTVDQTIAVDIMETAYTLQLLIEGESHGHIRGIEFHVSPKPSNKFSNRT